jgi:hypothetical protein
MDVNVFVLVTHRLFRQFAYPVLHCVSTSGQMYDTLRNCILIHTVRSTLAVEIHDHEMFNCVYQYLYSRRNLQLLHLKNLQYTLYELIVLRTRDVNCLCSSASFREITFMVSLIVSLHKLEALLTTFAKQIA